MPGDERVLDFAQEPARLKLSNNRMIVQRHDQPEVAVPLAQTAIVVVAHQQITCTGGLLAGLANHGGAMVVCDDSHMPVGMMLPIDAHNEQTKRIGAQVNVSKPAAKRIWKGIVRAKVRAQGHTLELHTGSDAGLYALALRVRSGDPENIESTAAQRYWVRLFDDPKFRRRREAPNQNRLLNYGYAIIRAAVGRAICATGLHPSLGVFHHGRNNAFVLADDLMEPYRTLVDDEVVEIAASFGGDVALDSAIKQRLIGVLHSRLWDSASGAGGESRTVIDWIGRTTSSLAQMYVGGDDAPSEVFYPQGLWSEASGT